MPPPLDSTSLAGHLPVEAGILDQIYANDNTAYRICRCLPPRSCRAWGRSLVLLSPKQSSRLASPPGQGQAPSLSTFNDTTLVLGDGLCSGHWVVTTRNEASDPHWQQLCHRDCRMVKVEYEDLPAVLSIEDAINAGSYFSVRSFTSCKPCF